MGSEPPAVWDIVLSVKHAMFSLGRLTVFAWAAALGASLCGLGAILLASQNLETAKSRRRRIFEGRGSNEDYLKEMQEDLSPGPEMKPGSKAWDAGFSVVENGFYLFLAGLVLLILGASPFLVAAN